MARQSGTSRMNIYKVYDSVYGPIDLGYGTTDYGELVILFDYGHKRINPHKYYRAKRHFDITLDYRDQKARVWHIERIPEPHRLSGTAMMMFANTMMQRLRMRSASVIDRASIPYIGCDNKQEKIPTLDLLAIEGDSNGWYEQFGFVGRYTKDRQKVAAQMKQVHDHILTGTVVHENEFIVKFSGKKTFGEVMRYWWNNDKCRFWAMYTAFVNHGLFDPLNDARADYVKNTVKYHSFELSSWLLYIHTLQ